MLDITWILAILSLSGNIFNVKRKATCFYIWALGEVFWFILDFINAAYGRAIFRYSSIYYGNLGDYRMETR